MSTVFVRARIEQKTSAVMHTQSQLFDSSRSERIAVFSGVDDPAMITVTMQFASLVQAQVYVGSPQFDQDLDALGMVGLPEVWMGWQC